MNPLHGVERNISFTAVTSLIRSFEGIRYMELKASLSVVFLS